MKNITDLHKYKQRHGIECVRSRNIFGAGVHRFRRRPSALPFNYDEQPERLISHVCLGSWPEFGLKSGDSFLVRPGPVRIGALIAIYYDGDLFFNLLLSRAPSGTIKVIGDDRKVVTLKRGEYEIEGEVMAKAGGGRK